MNIHATLAIAAAAGLAAATAHADPTPQDQAVLKTISEMQLYTREQALDAPNQTLARVMDDGTVGETTLICHLTDDLSVDMCIVFKELPPRHDLGKLAAFTVIRKARGDGKSQPGAWIRLTIRVGQQ